MEQDFEIGDRVLLTTEDMEMPAVVVGIVHWSDMFRPEKTYKLASNLLGSILEAHAGQIERAQ